MKTLVAASLFVLACGISSAQPRVTCTSTAASIACFDSLEWTLDVTGSKAADPFADVAVTGTFTREGDAPLAVDGFCDSSDGRTFRIRFMPTTTGTYRYAITYREGGRTSTHEGTFNATDERRRGMVRIDPEYSSHLQYDGTKERFFWNGIPGSQLVACDDTLLRERIEELDRARITGLLLPLPGCATEGEKHKAATIDPALWQRYERVVSRARERDMAVAIVMTPGSCEAPMVRYAAARLAAFRNVIWNFASSAAECSDAPCVQSPTTAVGAFDPYGHLTNLPGQPRTASVQAAGSAPASLLAGVRRAWEICLAGSYPTLDAYPISGAPAPAPTEETVDASALLEPYGHLYDFFTGVRWWEMQPSSDLVVSVQAHPSGASATPPRVFASRNPKGDLAAIYVPDGGVVTVKGDLLKDQLKPLWFSPRDGGMRNARALRQHVYRTPTAEDWVLLFRTPCNCSFRDFDNEFEN